MDNIDFSLSSSGQVRAEPKRMDVYIDDKQRLRSHKNPSYIGPSVKPIALICTLYVGKV